MNLKHIRSLFIFLLLGSHLIGLSQDGVNFNHRKVNKFVKKTYDIDVFALKEIKLNDNSIRGKYFMIISNNDSANTVYIGRVNSCRSGGCSIDNNPTEGSFEYFDYIIAFDENNRILNVKVYNYQATHGHEITAKWWLKQFRYKDNKEEFKVNKNIDAISGATISVFAITDDVNMVNEYLKEKLMK